MFKPQFEFKLTNNVLMYKQIILQYTQREKNNKKIDNGDIYHIVQVG